MCRWCRASSEADWAVRRALRVFVIWVRREEVWACRKCRKRVCSVTCWVRRAWRRGFGRVRSWFGLSWGTFATSVGGGFDRAR